MKPSEIIPRFSAKPTLEEAETAGYDAGANGSNTTNCHFKYFATPDLTQAWQRGYDAAKEGRANG